MLTRNNSQLNLQKFIDNKGYIRGREAFEIYRDFPDLRYLFNLRVNYEESPVPTYQHELKAGAHALEIIRRKYS